MAQGKTMGIPFLHPWANRLEGRRYSAAGREVVLAPGPPQDDHGRPMHGTLPRPFTVRETAAGDGVATLHATLDHDDEAFPFPHRIDQHITLGPQRLAIETVLTPTSDVAVPVCFGFHPYLVLPGAPRAQWTLTLPMRRHLLVDERGIPTGEDVHETAEELVLGERAFDDGYDGLAADPCFTIRGGGREIAMRMMAGYGAAQVFAPAGLDLIALEPMTSPTNALVSGRGLHLAAAGDAFRGLFEIHVARIA
jgi:aldose 1-epimerase